MAQLGDLDRAKALLRSAVRAFGPREVVARARCVVAGAEITLVSGDLGWPAKRRPTRRGRRFAKAISTYDVLPDDGPLTHPAG